MQLCCSTHTSPDVVRNCKCHAQTLCHVRPLLTVEAAKATADSIVGTRLDYCNSVTTVKNLDRLQHVQNNLARVPVSASGIDLWHELHWIPIRHRVVFKLATLTFKTKQFVKPAYLNNFLILEYQPEHCDHLQLIFYTDRSLLRHLIHVDWRSILFINIKSTSSLGFFKSYVKTELYSVAYPT